MAIATSSLETGEIAAQVAGGQPSAADRRAGLRLADGVIFTHELTAGEVATGILGADDDLALWAQFAIGGLPLAGGGEVRATTFLDQPPGVAEDLTRGHGLAGQMLTGPEGWLAPFAAGDLISVRLRDGALELSLTEPAQESSGTWRLRDACAFTAVDALKRYAEGSLDYPFAALHEILLDLLDSDPEIFAAPAPAPPLSRTLRSAGLETFGGSVGIAGTPWNLSAVRDLSRAETIAATMAIGMLLTWSDEDEKHPAKLLRQYLTFSPKVVGFVAGEVERRTFEGACFDDRLAALMAIAATAAERAAAALLTARAAEGAGDSGTAGHLVLEALAAQPDLPAALLDAGEYAACRGDARAADGYLRQCADPRATALRNALEPQLAPIVAAAGRNQPCPCGSGRKYKVCCLVSAVRPLPDRAAAIYALLATYAERAATAPVLGRLVARTGGNRQATLLCLDLMLTSGGICDRFLRARGDWLRGDERALAESWQRVPAGLFEVREVRRGSGVVIRRLPGGEPFFLRDRLFSAGSHRLDLFCGRILDDGSGPRMLSIPVPVDRDQRRELAELLASEPSAGQVAAFFAPPPAPRLLNSDGHDYYDAEVVWDVPGEPAAWARLADLFVLVDADILEWHVEDDGEIHDRGRVTRENGGWTLRANSRERLAELEEVCRGTAPGAREVRRKAERLGGEPHPRARTLTIDSPLVSAENPQADLTRRIRESWIDTVNYLGMTPREAAAAGGDIRAELELLLDDLEWRENRHAERGRPELMDVAWIRRELGLQP